MTTPSEPGAPEPAPSAPPTPEPPATPVPLPDPQVLVDHVYERKGLDPDRGERR
jgi:hypothetical protein